MKEEIVLRVESYIREVMYNESSGHDWWHVKRVHDLALKINEKENANEFTICNCGVVTKIGEDFDINKYREFGIDVAGVSTVKGKTTRFFQTFLIQDGQEREFRAERNPETKISIQDIPLEYLNNSKYIFLSTTLPENQLQLIKDIRKVSNVRIAVDTLKEFSEQPVTFDLWFSS